MTHTYYIHYLGDVDDEKNGDENDRGIPMRSAEDNIKCVM